jgi:hypothetical protein
MAADSGDFDDPSIPDQERLYRSVHREFVKPDGSPSSAAFLSRRDPDVSVDRSSLVVSPEITLARYAGHIGVAQLLAGAVRGLPQVAGVVPRPLADNPAHALIRRAPSAGSSTWKKAARDMARMSTWALAPTS